jgi:hypothetical protein
VSRPARSGYIAFVMALTATILVAACASPAASTSPSPAGASHDPAPVGHPLIGTWTTTITPDDLKAGGITDEGGLAENSGTFTWTFEADGTWRQVQTGLDGATLLNPVFSGWYTLDDDLLVMVTEFPEQYKDDGLRYEYVVTGDSVTFDLLNPPDPMLPVVVEAHPWARTQP